RSANCSNDGSKDVIPRKAGIIRANSQLQSNAGLSSGHGRVTTRGSGGVFFRIVEQFLAEDGHIAWGFDSQANFAPVNFHYRNRDILVDDDLFTLFSTQNKHVATLL